MSVWSTVDDLAVCLCAQFETDGGPSLCFCGLVPGSDVAVEYMGDCEDVCGMAWVQIGSAYPSVSVGSPDLNPNNCAKGIGVDVQIGVARCMPVGDRTGEGPTPDQLRAAVEQQVADLATIRRAVLCCQDAADFVLGPAIPFGPQGGTYGWNVELNFLVP